MTTEGGISRVLAQVTQVNNSILLNRNYDAINPRTGQTYLGVDGIPNSGDEGNTVVDEWTGYDPSGSACFLAKGIGAPTLEMTGTIAGSGSYTIRAYRYDQTQGVGKLLVEANQGGLRSAVLIGLSVQPNLDDFPGVLVSDWGPGGTALGALALRGREIRGSKGNVYFSPTSSPDSSLYGSSDPGDSDRPDYLNGVWSNTVDDGATGDYHLR